MLKSFGLLFCLIMGTAQAFVPVTQRRAALASLTARAPSLAPCKKTSPFILASKTSEDEGSSKKGRSKSKTNDTFLDLVNSGDLDDIAGTLEKLPYFLQKVVAIMLEMDVGQDLDPKGIALRVNQAMSGDYSFSSKPKPSFTNEDIEDMKRSIEKDQISLPDKLIKNANGDDTKLATSALEYDYYIMKDDQETKEIMQLAYQGDDWMKLLSNSMMQG